MLRSVIVGVVTVVLILLNCGTFSWAADKTQDAACVIEKLVTASAIKDREPVGESTEFDAASGKVYCWMKVTCSHPPTKVKHIWYKGEQNVFEIGLEMKYATMRTWSAKDIAPGDWKVDVVDDADQVLGSVSFHVK